MKRLAYFVGEPGVGKSTFVRNMLAPHLADFGRDQAPFEVWGADLGRQTAYLGRLHDPVFPGTDRLSLSAQPKVLAWLADPSTAARYELVIGEGDRIGHASFLAGAGALGWEVFVLHLVSDQADARRAARAEAHGLRPQSTPWVMGRRNKVARFVREAVTNPHIAMIATADTDAADPAGTLALLLGKAPASAPTFGNLLLS